MNSFRLNRRRFRVVARPQVRARRARVGAAALAVLALGCVAFATARRLVLDLRIGSTAPRTSSAATVAGPEPLRALAQAVADGVAGSAGEKAAAVKARFACVADVRVRRSWTDKVATLTLVTRRPVAAAWRRGKAAGFLDADGALFDAPEGVFQLSGAGVDVGAAPRSELALLAREWPALASEGAFPAALKSMAYRSSEEDWEARLADGTIVLWGRLEWTRAKLARLAEAVTDARSRAPGAFSADLRWFEDGKVLLKPREVVR